MVHLAPNRASIRSRPILMALALLAGCATHPRASEDSPVPSEPEVVEGILSWVVGDPADGGAPRYYATLTEADGSIRTLTVTPARFREWITAPDRRGGCVRAMLRPDPDRPDAWILLNLEPCR